MALNAILQEALELQPYIVDLRRRLHSCPELSYKEYKTSGLLADILAAEGFAITRGLATTGMVADFGSGERTIAVRAEMDALPITEGNHLAFRSTNDGVMHACGHDAHMACAIAAATMLSRRLLPGRLRMIVQPAEEAADDEGMSGANRMVQEHVMDGVDAIIGLHVSSSVPVGKVAIPSGAVFASADDFRISIEAHPHRSSTPGTCDVVVIASQIIQALQQVVSRKLSPLEPAVVTVGAIHTVDRRAFAAPRELVMQGTVRTFSETTRIRIWDEMQRVCSLATVYGATAKLTCAAGYPATINDQRVAHVMQSAAADLIGTDNVITIVPRMAAEDFSFFARATPAAFMLLGVELAGDRRNHHSADFDLDESGLYVGAAILAETVWRLMKMQA